MLSSQETELRIAAGETIAMFYEIGRIEDEVCISHVFQNQLSRKRIFQE